MNKWLVSGCVLVMVALSYAQDQKASPPAVGETRTFTLPGNVALEMVWIPAGTFRMGSPELEPPGVIFGVQMTFENEQPAHRVTISQGFWLGKYEVTQAQWEAVMGGNPSRFPGEERPVEQVSWDDVQAFIGKLNEAAGEEVYRLPTEAEWEYACRAGTTTRWSFGDDATKLGEYAWFRYNSGGSTQPVGQKRPNPWGLYDLHGNVWEWVQDWYGPYSGEAQTDPTGPSSGSRRVYRGGSWRLDSPSIFRGAYRDWITPGHRGDYLGFRLARTGS